MEGPERAFKVVVRSHGGHVETVTAVARGQTQFLRSVDEVDVRVFAGRRFDDQRLIFKRDEASVKSSGNKKMKQHRIALLLPLFFLMDASSGAPIKFHRNFSPGCPIIHVRMMAVKKLIKSHKTKRLSQGWQLPSLFTKRKSNILLASDIPSRHRIVTPLTILRPSRQSVFN